MKNKRPALFRGRPFQLPSLRMRRCAQYTWKWIGGAFPFGTSTADPLAIAVTVALSLSVAALQRRTMTYPQPCAPSQCQHNPERGVCPCGFVQVGFADIGGSGTSPVRCDKTTEEFFGGIRPSRLRSDEPKLRRCGSRRSRSWPFPGRRMAVHNGRRNPTGFQ
jgi:hypothetical protein